MLKTYKRLGVDAPGTDERLLSVTPNTVADIWRPGIRDFFDIV
jgi:hypothetical protein